MVFSDRYMIVKIPAGDGVIHLHEILVPAIATIDEWLEWWDNVVEPVYSS